MTQEPRTDDKKTPSERGRSEAMSGMLRGTLRGNIVGGPIFGSVLGLLGYFSGRYEDRLAGRQTHPGDAYNLRILVLIGIATIYSSALYQYYKLDIEGAESFLFATRGVMDRIIAVFPIIDTVSQITDREDLLSRHAFTVSMLLGVAGTFYSLGSVWELGRRIVEFNSYTVRRRVIYWVSLLIFFPGLIYIIFFYDMGFNSQTCGGYRGILGSTCGMYFSVIFFGAMLVILPIMLLVSVSGLIAAVARLFGR